MRNARQRSRPAIPPIGYQPPKGYRLDIELFPLSTFRTRATAETERIPRRLEFHLLVYLDGPACTHTVDFESLSCPGGSMLILRPGQVHRFESSARANGWVVLFQSEFLQPRTVPSSQAPELTARLAGFPMLLTLNPDEQAAIREAMARMFLDAQLAIRPHVLHALLRPQLQAVLQRLAIAHDRTEQAQQTAPTLLQRFRQFRDAVEQDFAREHRVAPYSRRIGCSEKSLGRACWAVAGLSAKSLVSQRIVLEARRLLVHTDLQIAEISEQLGFDEPTNFVKFFRREADITPGEFRRQQTLTPRAHLG